MKLADNGGLVWVIIVVVVALVKGWAKLQKPANDDAPGSDESPVALPRPSRLPRPQRQPQPPMMAISRPGQSQPRTAAPSGPRPIAAPAARESRNVDADEIRRFIEQLSGQPQAMPQPPPIAPPPVPTAEAPAPPPKPEPVADVAALPQTVAEAPAPTEPSRSNQWAQALQDRQNIRNIIISAEIIGPPRGETI